MLSTDWFLQESHRKGLCDHIALLGQLCGPCEILRTFFCLITVDEKKLWHLQYLSSKKYKNGTASVLAGGVSKGTCFIH